jgi:hypothetical protein
MDSKFHSELDTGSLGGPREIERATETNETGGARRSERPGKRVGDWRVTEARANSRFPESSGTTTK